MNLKQIKESIKYSLRSRKVIHRYIEEVENFYSMGHDELRKNNEIRFLRIFQQAFQNSQFYHDLYTEAGISLNDVKSLDDLKKLPIITKEMIRDRIDDMLLIPKWKTIRNHTSGTTGKPLVVYEDWPSIWREQAYFYSYRKRCGYTFEQDVIASLRGHLDRKTTSMYVGNSKTLYLSSFNLSNDTIEEYYTLLKKYKPIAIEGYPSSLFNLAKLLEEKGYEVEIPVGFTSSETLDVNKRKFIERVLHTQLYDHYGNTERTIRLEEAIDHQGYYEDPGYSINEYEDDRVITTSLINESFPLIRYQVDDNITLKPNFNPDSSHDAIVIGINGRAADCIIGKDGTHFSGAALTYFAKAIPNIQTVQLIQKGAEIMQVNIVPDKKFSDADKDSIRSIVDEIIGLDNIDYKVTIIDSSELIYSKNNKLSLIVRK